MLRLGLRRCRVAAAPFRSLSTVEPRKFEAETSKLLHLLSHSLYKNPAVFLRELVSNSSDALEKLRHGRVSGASQSEHDLEISVDVKDDSLVVSDTGVGMSPEEMASNLGTIARSGTKEFVESNKDDVESLIGQFGVGFYSTFVVADQVRVISKNEASEDVYSWKSKAGDDSYELSKIQHPPSDLPNANSFTVVELKLNPDKGAQFKQTSNVESALKKYSSFVSFPLKLNGNVVNSSEAIWLRAKSDISNEEYEEFYKSITDDEFGKPKLTMHLKMDVPLEISALMFVPDTHEEKRGMGRMEPGVSLYSRRVLLASPNEANLLPSYLRFVKGVVDSSDLPMSVTRESVLDDDASAPLLKKISSTLTKRILRSLADFAKKQPNEYLDEIWAEFGHFLKEGASNDYAHQQEIAKLLRYDSSLTLDKKTSLDEYVSRMPPWQKHVYFLSAPNRQIALKSPYYQAFKRKSVEVLFAYHPLDDFVFGSLGSYEGRKLMGCEGGAVEDELLDDEDDNETTEAHARITQFATDSLGPDRVISVQISKRPLGDAVSLVVDHESAGLRKMMLVLQQETGETAPPLAPQRLELNASHPLFVKLDGLIKNVNKGNNREAKQERAKALVELFLDSALIDAGLVDDVREVWPNAIKLLAESKL